MSNPYDVVRDFEEALCAYTGAPYAVTVNSCTMALLLAIKYHLRNKSFEYKSNSSRARKNQYRIDRTEINIPKHTYVSVPQSIIHAGGQPTFRDEEWIGAYQLKPFPIWDSAREFTTDMFLAANICTPGAMLCVSFHASKILGDTQGGAILHNDPEADAWFRKARFDGRTEGVKPKDDHFDMVGFHCYMSPDVAARLLLKLSVLPMHNDPLPNDDYPDLSLIEAFK